MNDVEASQQIEGLLFALGEPLLYTDIQKLLSISDEVLHATIAHLRAQRNRGVVVVDDGKMIELRVAPEVSELVERVRRNENSRDIGRAGLEVLAAILYRGPLTRAEIDFIRGVQSSQTIRTLTTRGLVRRVPHLKDDRSFLYEATTELLATLGSTHPRDLPDFDVVRQKLSQLEESYKKVA